MDNVGQGPETESVTDLPPRKRYSEIEVIMLRAMSPPDGNPKNWTNEAKLERIFAALDAAGFTLVPKNVLKEKDKIRPDSIRRAEDPLA